MSQENVEILRRLYERWTGGDIWTDFSYWNRAVALEADGLRG